MADLQVKTANICNITSSTLLRPNAGGSGTYIADNSISVHMTNQHRASGIYISSLPEQSVIGDKYTISFVPVCATNNVMLVVLYGATTQISFTSGNRYTLTITATAADNTMAFYGGDTVEKTVIIKDIQIEKGETATVYRPYSATGWLHSLRKLGTATEAVENPLYSDGTAITAYTLKGNEEHTGTPSPQNPVDVNGVGVRTENLFDINTIISISKGTIANDIITSSVINANYDGVAINLSLPIAAGTYYVSASIRLVSGEAITMNKLQLTNTGASITTITNPRLSVEFKRYCYKNNISSDRTATQIYFQLGEGISNAVIEIKDIMVSNVNADYEPYGYKIPISNGQQTINIYIGDLPLLKSLDGTAVDEISNGTLTRRVDSDGSVLPTPITTQITMPSIPTTEGANSISVDTTVQPSEFTATWTGWHDASVKEWDGSDWQ